MKRSNPLRKARRGGVLISALAFVTVTSMLVVGMLTMSVSFYARAKTEADYEKALALAEAGANYEFRKISSDTSTADQRTNGTGVTYSLGGGAFNVYCSNKDGSAPWVAPADMYVTSVGTINGVSRTVRVSGMGYGNAPNFAVFSINDFKIHASNPTIVGDCGTNGTTSLHGHISGSYYVCGPGASGTGAGANCPTVVLPAAITWPTVDAKALTLYPNSGATAPGGLLYLASHNSNASASPALPTLNATITGSITLVGPGNYFVKSINLINSSQITFNNTNGPINLWVGPAGSAGMVNIDDTATGVTSAPMSTNPVVIYVATTGGVQMHSSPTITADWYVYNTTAGGSGYGSFSGWNNPTINGSVLCYSFFNSGDTLINYMPGVPCPYNSIDHYGFDDQWLEINGL